MNIEIINSPSGVSLKAKRGKKPVIEFHSESITTNLSPPEREICRRMVISSAFEEFFPGRMSELVEYSTQLLDPSLLPTEERMLKELEELS